MIVRRRGRRSWHAAAITARKHHLYPIVVVPVAPAALRTKPALNVALPFARGVFTVIYATPRTGRSRNPTVVPAGVSFGERRASPAQRGAPVHRHEDDLALTLFQRRVRRAFLTFSSKARGTRLAVTARRVVGTIFTLQQRCCEVARLGSSQCHEEDADLGMRFAASVTGRV